MQCQRESTRTVRTGRDRPQAAHDQQQDADTTADHRGTTTVNITGSLTPFLKPFFGHLADLLADPVSDLLTAVLFTFPGCFFRNPTTTDCHFLRFPDAIFTRKNGAGQQLMVSGSGANRNRTTLCQYCVKAAKTKTGNG